MCIVNTGTTVSRTPCEWQSLPRPGSGEKPNLPLAQAEVLTVYAESIYHTFLLRLDGSMNQLTDDPDLLIYLLVQVYVIKVLSYLGAPSNLLGDTSVILCLVYCCKCVV